MHSQKSEEFYQRWPSDYLYKFIIPSEQEKITKIHQIFDNTGAVIESKQSKKGTYTSITITVSLKDPDAVIQKYKEVGVIKGVISL